MLLGCSVDFDFESWRAAATSTQYTVVQLPLTAKFYTAHLCPPSISWYSCQAFLCWEMTACEDCQLATSANCQPPANSSLDTRQAHHGLPILSPWFWARRLQIPPLPNSILLLLLLYVHGWVCLAVPYILSCERWAATSTQYIVQLPLTAKFYTAHLCPLDIHVRIKSFSFLLMACDLWSAISHGLPILNPWFWARQSAS